MKRALITGITGQDGSYLAEFLLSKPDVRSPRPRPPVQQSQSAADRPLVWSGTLDPRAVPSALRRPGGCLESRRGHGTVAARRGLQPRSAKPRARLVRPAALYRGRGRPGNAPAPGSGPPPRPFKAGPLLPGVELRNVRVGRAAPRTEHAVPPAKPVRLRAKLYGHWQTVNYREAYDLFACSGILFNHEAPGAANRSSPARSRSARTRIKEGLQQKLVMGNLDAKRDWGIRRRLRSGHVADAPAGPARRLRRGDG